MITDPEFREQYKRLVEVHPHYFSSKEKMDTIWEHVKTLDVDWFRRQVDNIVMAVDIRSEKYDLGYAARQERNARRSAEFAKAVSDAADAWKRVNGQGLESILEKYNSGSLVEAVDKSRKGEL